MIKNIYFGDSTRGTPTKRITYRPLSWKGLCHTIETGIATKLTRNEFTSLSKIDRTKEKAATYILSATFKAKTRGNEQAQQSQLVILDLDDHKAAGALIKLLRRGIPKKLAHFNMIYCPTTSSTPEALRGRLIIDTQLFDKAYYANVVTNIAKILDIEIDRASKVVSQPFYLTLRFAEDPFECLIYDSQYPTGVVEQFFELDGVSPQQTQSEASQTPPDARVDISDLKEAVAYLPIDLGKDNTFSTLTDIAFGIRHQLPNDYDIGLSIINMYEARLEGNDYANGRIVGYYEKSVANKKGGSITIARFLEHAFEGGWIKTQHCFKNLVLLLDSSQPFYDVVEHQLYSTASLNTAFNKFFVDPKTPLESIKQTLASTYATSVLSIKKYTNVMFYPGGDSIFKWNDSNGQIKEFVNSYVPIEKRHPPNHKAADEALSIIQDHVNFLVNDAFLETQVMCFLANAVQNPSTPAQFALTLISETRGVGKSIMFDWISAIMPAQQPTYTEYTSKFSDFLHPTQALLIDEVKPGRKASFNLTNSLKPVIQGKSLRVHPKGSKGFHIPNKLNTFIFGNYEDIISARDEQRRFLYIVSKVTVKEKEKRRISGGFIPADKLSGRPRDIVAALLKYEISWDAFTTENAFLSNAYTSLTEDTKGRDAILIQELIDNKASPGVTKHIVSIRHVAEVYKNERDTYIQSTILTGLRELSFTKDKNRLWLPAVGKLDRCLLTLYINRDSTLDDIEKDKKALQDFHVERNSQMLG